MFLHVFGVATLGKPVIALGIIASAYGAAGSFDRPEYRTTTPPARETTRPQTTLSFSPAAKTEKPAPTTAPRTTKTPAPTTATTTVSFDALLSECVARYKRGATNTKEACERAIAASGLSTESFVAKYRSLLVPPAKTETMKPTATPKPTTPKPTTAPKLDTTDPKVRECLAKYEAVKSLKASGAETFDAALKYFNETCKNVLGARG